jgi:hypothetical protein
VTSANLFIFYHLISIAEVINQIIIPLLGLSGIPALFMIVSEEVQSAPRPGNHLGLGGGFEGKDYGL